MYLVDNKRCVSVSFQYGAEEADDSWKAEVATEDKCGPFPAEVARI
jgi:hypothetical protein